MTRATSTLSSPQTRAVPGYSPRLTEPPSDAHDYGMVADDERYHHGNLKESVLREAVTLAVEEGEAAITMRAIAKRIGVTHRAIYRWYADRDALLAAIAAHAFAGLAEAIAPEVEAAAPEQRRAAFVRAYLQYALDCPALYRIAMTRDRADLRRTPAMREAVDRLVTVSRQALPGDGDQGRDYVMAHWALLHGIYDIYRGGLPALVDDETFIAYAQKLAGKLSDRQPELT